MSVLHGLRKTLKDFYEKKDYRINDVAINDAINIDINQTDLTSEEMSLLFRGDVSFSEDSKFILARLNSFLKILEERDYSRDRAVLNDFVYDIRNWYSQIYIEEKKPFNWLYQTNIKQDKNEKIYNFELKCGDKKVMCIDVITTLKGRLLEFGAKYHTDISSYVFERRNSIPKAKFGTMVIDIKCPIDGNIILSDVIYNLDLLGDEKISLEKLDNNVISVYQCSLTGNKVRK